MRRWFIEMNNDIFHKLTPEERKHLATLGSMLTRPMSEDEEEIQRLMDACVDLKDKEGKKE